MPVLLIALAQVLIGSLAYWYLGSVRLALISTAVVTGIFILVSSEFLSLLHAFTPAGIATAWLILVIVSAAMCWRTRPFKPLQIGWSRWSFAIRIFAFFVVMIVVVVLITGIVAPPNNWDSMTYHMARVEHWLHNGTLAHYPTSIMRQLYQHPWAEIAIAHLQALSGNDYFANLVQGSAFVGSILVVSLIAQGLGLNTFGQISSSVLTATIPMAILQGSSTQNDLVTAFWVVTGAYGTLRITQSGWEGKRGWLRLAATAAAFGLALATKATAYIYITPFVLWVGSVLLWRYRAKAFIAGVGMGLIILILNMSIFLRNHQLFGSITGPETAAYVNQTMSPALLASNVVRNLHAHLTPPTFLERRFHLVDRIDRAVRNTHAALAVDIFDSRTTAWPVAAVGPYGFGTWRFEEDGTSAPLHLLMVCICFVLYVLFAWRTHRWLVDGYILCLLAGFILFCFILRMQPWHNRLHLSLFVLMPPLIAYVLARLFPQWLIGVCLGIFLLSALEPTLDNINRPWLETERSIWTLGRWEQRFVKHPGLAAPYTDVFAPLQTSGCEQIGLLIGGDSWEYPLWARARELNLSMVFQHLNLQEMPEDHRVPCAIISDTVADSHVTLGDQVFQLSWENTPLRLYLPVT